MTGMTKVVGVDGTAEAASNREGEGDAEGAGGGPPTLPPPGAIRETATATANTTAATAAIATTVSRSMNGNRHRAHVDRRDWRVVRTSTAIARRVDSGSSVGPSSSHATTTALASRGGFMPVVPPPCRPGYRRRSPRAWPWWRDAVET